MGPPFGYVVAFSSPDRARFFGPEFANVILPLYSGSAFVLSPNPWCPVKKSFCPSVVILSCSVACPSPFALFYSQYDVFYFGFPPQFCVSDMVFFGNSCHQTFHCSLGDSQLVIHSFLLLPRSHMHRSLLVRRIG